MPAGCTNGTLATRFCRTPLAGHVHAKTGTLLHSDALSGFVTAPGKSALLFSALADNVMRSADDVRKTIDAAVLAAFKCI